VVGEGPEDGKWKGEKRKSVKGGGEWGREKREEEVDGHRKGSWEGEGRREEKGSRGEDG
jgi:hypothetical protein